MPRARAHGGGRKLPPNWPIRPLKGKPQGGLGPSRSLVISKPGAVVIPATHQPRGLAERESPKAISPRCTPQTAHGWPQIKHPPGWARLPEEPGGPFSWNQKCGADWCWGRACETGSSAQTLPGPATKSLAGGLTVFRRTGAVQFQLQPPTPRLAREIPGQGNHLPSPGPLPSHPIPTRMEKPLPARLGSFVAKNWAPPYQSFEHPD
ncbi:MAG: hypothetical protein CM15mP116_00460 [Synechococcus sp.]|nr:MAG: hypothetical protein CM15mP116_00460 [Synechococcus sp.]